MSGQGQSGSKGGARPQGFGQQQFRQQEQYGGGMYGQGGGMGAPAGNPGATQIMNPWAPAGHVPQAPSSSSGGYGGSITPAGGFGAAGGGLSPVGGGFGQSGRPQQGWGTGGVSPMNPLGRQRPQTGGIDFLPPPTMQRPGTPRTGGLDPMDTFNRPQTQPQGLPPGTTRHASGGFGSGPNGEYTFEDQERERSGAYQGYR